MKVRESVGKGEGGRERSGETEIKPPRAGQEKDRSGWTHPIKMSGTQSVEVI